MECLQLPEDQRDWNKWKELQALLAMIYKSKEEYWHKKSTISWLREWDRNTKFFYVVTAERRKRNRLKD